MDDDKPDYGEAFALEASDEDILQLIKKPIEESESYWDSNERFKLSDTRKANLDLWLGNHWNENDAYDHEKKNLYVNNRIFTGVETSVAIVNSRIPQPEVMPSAESMISEQAAKDVQNALFAHADKHRTLDKFRVAARNLKLKRIGILKLRWDPNFGEHGDIVPESILPEDIVVSKDARLDDNPRFIAQRLRNKTIEELVTMFPENEQKILEWYGVKRKNKQGDLVAYKTQLAKEVDIWEVHFTFSEKASPWEAVAWVDADYRYVLGKTKTPNWNYEQKEGHLSNFLDYPLKPYIPINFLNDGSSWIDLTTEVEQAAKLQRALNRRGFQIGMTADQSGSGTVFNTQMISKEDMKKIIGDPKEAIGVKGNVGNAMMRIPPPQLQPFVYQDKLDNRAEIDNVFATHAPTRGESGANKTLGQDVMQRDQDYTRQDEFARAMEKAATLYYRYLVQMMKVYYTEDHWFKINGEDGQFDYVVLNSDKIEDGIEVKVEAGSMIPIDKQAQHDNALSLAQSGLIDPLSLYEILGMPNPKKMMERLLKFQVDPQAFESQVKEEDMNREALMDIEVLNRGVMPRPRQAVGPEYLQFRQRYMLSPEFQKLPPLTQQLHVEHLRMASQDAQRYLQLLQTQPPTEEEMQAANAKAVEQAQTEQAVMGSQPQTGIEQTAEQVAQGVDQNNQLLEDQQQPVA